MMVGCRNGKDGRKNEMWQSSSGRKRSSHVGDSGTRPFDDAIKEKIAVVVIRLHLGTLEQH